MSQQLESTNILEIDLPDIPNTKPGKPTSGRRGRPSHGKKSKFKTEIDEIIDHKCDKHGVKFQVSWIGSECVTYETAFTVATKKGLNQLCEYLRELNEKNELRFTNMMLRVIRLCGYLEENEQNREFHLEPPPLYAARAPEKSSDH